MANLKEIMKKYPLGGRPKSFKKPEDLRNKLWEYLADCEDRVIPMHTKDGEVMVHSKAPITVEGFCAFIGITKQTFYAYRKKREFAGIVNQFRQIVEKYYVEQLVEGKPGNKSDFVLKNSFGDEWKEKGPPLLPDGVEKVILEIMHHDRKDEDGTDIRAAGESTEEV